MLHCLTTELVLVFGLECLFLLLDDEFVTVSSSKVSAISECILVLNFNCMVDLVRCTKVLCFLLNSYIFTGFTDVT